ncbi:erythromycin esterase family protein [Streptomyces sp. NBC_01387]|uniref:erythromycin esterase family protein n=1 Tax=unclassified Streptomyces TaxID=2593676 RepID=UPI002DDC7470|nr:MULTISPECIES: erythromycin esterase family protein [unclassified Streptomyces]WSC21426.1 erythromycin esterase family protein [Streptomyces sp. NBC_01766]
MIGNRTRLVAAAIALAATLAPATAAYASSPAAPVSGPTHTQPQTQTQTPVGALDRIAHPLRSAEPGTGTADLRALGVTVGDAKVVGVGEATHGSHEFFALKDRLFRYLVEKKGFTTFALEISWSAGLQIDDYVQHGSAGGGADTGGDDARQVVHEVMAGSPWDREEFVTLVRWMRDHNRQHPDRPVHFMGDDIGAPRLDGRVFDAVTDYVGRTHPESLPRLNELLTGLRPLDDAIGYLNRPLAERQQNAARAQQMLDLVEQQGRPGDDSFDFALQNARNIAQTYTFLAVDPGNQESLTAMERYRDQVMAETTEWWQRRTGDRILLSAHDDHVGYVSSDPTTYPKTQGSFLHDSLGADYLALGTTFDQGSFLSKDQALGGDWKKFTVGPAGPGSNEYTLDQVRYRDYYADLRKLPAASRSWLDVARPTCLVGTEFPNAETPELAIGKAYDVLVHLHTVREATELPAG